jgi:flagellar protein FliS
LATLPNPSHTAQQYLRTRVMTATPEQLQLMLYDGAVRFTEAARSALDRRDLEGVHANVTKAQAIVTELLSSLRPTHGVELCSRLAGLYRHVYRKLIEVGYNHRPESADEALEALRHQRETWSLLLEQMGREKAAGRARGTTAHPTVSAGLSIAA